MTPRIANISTALCLTVLCSCTAMPPRNSVPPNVRALLEPTPGASKPLDALKTERDEQESNIELTGALQMCNWDKGLALDHLERNFTPVPWWKLPFSVRKDK